MKKGGNDHGAAEVVAFLAIYNTKAVSEKPELQRTIRAICKRFAALLVWQDHLAGGVLWRKRRRTVNFRSHVLECCSDITQATLLSCQGLYKPANLILRSAIENAIKAIGVAHGQNVLSITSTYDLIRSVRKIRLIEDSRAASKCYSNLIGKYDELCKFVHTADEQHMSLTAFLHDYPEYDAKRAAYFEATVKTTVVAICGLLALTFPKKLRSMHHRHADLIYDMLPAGLKSELAEL